MNLNLPFLLHAVGWAVYLLFNFYAVGLKQPRGFYLAHQGVYLALNAVLFYANYLYFIPQLLARERALRFFLFNGLVLASLPGGGHCPRRLAGPHLRRLAAHAPACPTTSR
jgi:hypothetical protein